MPTIVYQTNQKTGVKYAYLSKSYWDKDKKAPRSTRKYLGRVDPETGEIIKGSGKNRQVVKVPEDGTAVYEVPEWDEQDETNGPDERDARIASLEARLAEMTERYEEAAGLLREISALAGKLRG
jgi:hypothetical protein